MHSLNHLQWFKALISPPTFLFLSCLLPFARPETQALEAAACVLHHHQLLFELKTLDIALKQFR